MVDALCGDLDYEEGGNPVVSNRLFAALDPVLCDTFVANEMGYTVDEIPYIAMAGDLGAGSTDLSAAHVRHLNPAADAGASPNHRQGPQPGPLPARGFGLQQLLRGGHPGTLAAGPRGVGRPAGHLMHWTGLQRPERGGGHRPVHPGVRQIRAGLPALGHRGFGTTCAKRFCSRFQ